MLDLPFHEVIDATFDSPNCVLFESKQAILSVTAAFRNQQLHMSQEHYVNRTSSVFLCTLVPSWLLNYLFKAICLN